MKRMFWALVCGLFLMGNARAQATLGIDTAMFSYSYNPTTSMLSMEPYSVTVHNFSTASFVGTYTVVYAVDTLFDSIPPVQLDSNTVSNITILAGQGVPDSTTLLIDSTNFRHGINTVVIWPRVSSGTTADSLRIPVMVVGWAGIQNPDLVIRPRLFPNPAKQEIFIGNPDPKQVIEQVRIWTAEGKLMLQEKFTGKVNVSTLSAGFYYVEFETVRGKLSRYKLIKE